MRPSAGGLASLALLGWALMRARRRPRFSFEGKVVLVTGGSRGLGLALARDAAAAGAVVAICGRNPDTLARAAAALRRQGGRVLAVPADVTDLDSVRELIRTVTASLGQIDVLITCAGAIEVGPAGAMTLADYDEAMRTNFWGTVYPVLEVIPSMRERGRGCVINITSIGGKLGVPHLLPYSASKFAAVGFSQGLRAEVRADGVMVTTATPGLMRTGSPRNAVMRGRHAAEYAWFSIADSLPVLSVSADEASRRILEAARRGDAQVTFPVVARLAVIASALAPNLSASALALAGSLLPSEPAGATGRKRGKDSQSAWSPSWLTRRGDRAARRFNQIAPDEAARA